MLAVEEGGCVCTWQRGRWLGFPGQPRLIALPLPTAVSSPSISSSIATQNITTNSHYILHFLHLTLPYLAKPFSSNISIMAAQRLSSVLSHMTPGQTPMDKMYASASSISPHSRVVSLSFRLVLS